MKKKLFIIVICVLVLVAITNGFLIWKNWDGIKDSIKRTKRDFRMSDNRQIRIETYAGCQIKTMIDQESNESFSQMWEKDSKRYDFDVIDIDNWMMDRCHPISDEESRVWLANYFNSVDFPDMDEEKEERLRLERSMSMNSYQRKFLNREFSTLKDEPKSEFLSEIAPE